MHTRLVAILHACVVYLACVHTRLLGYTLVHACILYCFDGMHAHAVGCAFACIRIILLYILHFILLYLVMCIRACLCFGYVYVHF
jgi:hypothetical protein